jgi:hypothetical protein
LLNPHSLVAADWHGIGVHVSQTLSVTRLEFIVRRVFDPIRIKTSGKAGKFTGLMNLRLNLNLHFPRLVTGIIVPPKSKS